MTYRELYNEVENPLTNENIHKILEQVIKKRDEYHALISNDPQEETRISVNDRDEFYKLIYQKWRKGVLELSDKKIDELIKAGRINEDFKNFRDEMLKIPEVNTFEDYRKIARKAFESDELEDAYDKYGMIYDNGFYHIDSSYYDYDTRRDKTSHRLYINMDSINGYKFVTEFIKKCDKRNIPYYFKFIFPDRRDDSIVIYSSTKHITDYIEILREIKKENEDLVKNVKNPPIITAPIDGWIGYGTEPKIKKSSYNKIRSEVLEDVIKEESDKWYEENKNKIFGKDNKESLIEILADIYTDRFIEQHKKYNKTWEKEFKQAGLPPSDLDLKHVRETIYRQYVSAITKILNNETEKGYYILYNNQPLGFRNVSKRGIVYDILKVAYENDKENIAKRIKENITSKCRENGISPSKFCMDIAVIKEMMAYSKMKYGDDLKDITVVKKKEKKKKDTKDILDDIWDKTDTKKDTKTTLEEMWDKVDTKTDTKSKLDDIWDKVDTKSDSKKDNNVEDDIIKLVVDSEKEKVFDDNNKDKVKDEDKASKEALQDYKNSGYGKNVYGWYYNPNIDEYDKDYDPTKDPFFNKELQKKPPVKKKEIKKQNDLKNIIVYTAINRRNEIKNRAFLIYDDGTIKNVDEERFTKEIAQIARNKKVSNYGQLESMGILEFTTVKDLVKDWNNYFDNNKEDVVSRYKSA